MKHTRSIALLGNVGGHGIRVVQDAAAAAGVSVTRVKNHEDLARAIAVEEPLAILIAADSDNAFECCVGVRARHSLAHVPILCVGTRKSNFSFVQLFQWGGDDLISIETEIPLARRLRGLVDSPPAPAGNAGGERGEAIVATSDKQAAAVLARTLSNAGYVPRIVDNAIDALAKSHDARVVVAADDLAPLGAEFALASAREEGDTTPWVIVAAPKRIASSRAAVVGIPRVVVIDAFSPPENVLFATNDLVRQGSEQRMSPRLLFGTNVVFRAAGSDDEDEIGFTYNVSTTGIYVRTLAPLHAGSEVWLELWAPQSERRVRLAGRVAWQRRFGANLGATVPAGFGVHLFDGLGEDLRRWREGCEMLMHDDGRMPSILPRPMPPSRPSVILSSLLDRAMI